METIHDSAGLRLANRKNQHKINFSVLGPLKIFVGQQQLRLGSSREQKIMATLLLDADRVVPMTRLVDTVWDDDPPDTAAKAIRNCVSATRRRLAVAGGANGLITTEPGGYTLHTKDSQLDLQAFTDHVTRGRDFAKAGHLEAAVKRLRAALTLWHGQAFSDVNGRNIQASAARLNERRISVHEECLSYEITLGRDYQLLDELSALVTNHPFRERPRAHLMLALYRIGRRTEALETFRRTRDLLVAELGIEPGPELVRLHRAILNDDNELLELMPREKTCRSSPYNSETPLRSGPSGLTWTIDQPDPATRFGPYSTARAHRR